MCWEQALTTQTPTDLRCCNNSTSSSSVSSSAIEGVCVALDGPRVRPLRLLLLALISCVCWRWADVTVAEKFIYSLMLYTRFLLHSGGRGVLLESWPGYTLDKSAAHRRATTTFALAPAGPFCVPNFSSCACFWTV